MRPRMLATACTSALMGCAGPQQMGRSLAMTETDIIGSSLLPVAC